MTAPSVHRQAGFARRCDWGLAGARALVAHAHPAEVAVVVDVLSFTTTLTVALERGIAVHPYPWADADAASYAEERGAVLAVGRREGVATGAVSLSPASYDDAVGVDRLVLPSPNGSSIAFALADAGVRVVGASLRNATAVGQWVAALDGVGVAVVAAGERWPDGELRPGVEDLWGAGAVLRALREASGDEDAESPEARSAVAAYVAVRDDLPEALAACASGEELVAAGFARDVEIAAEVDVSHVVPLLEGDVFHDAATQVRT